jgi:hypothetical protein
MGEEDTAMTPRRSLAPKWASSEAKGPRLADRLLRLCVPIGVAALLHILLLFGFSWWSALAIAFLIAGHLAIVWVLVTQRRLPGSPGTKQ